MKKPTAPSLSGHLSSEADRFFLYPDPVRRSVDASERRARMYDNIARLLPWKSTFTLASVSSIATRFAQDDLLLDEVYCRELLSAVSGFVERTRKLVPLSHEALPTGPPQVYVQEATRTYIAGFFAAAVVLARAAVESALKQEVARRFGAGKDSELENLIDFALRSGIVSDTAHAAAHRVRSSGNRVLHKNHAEVTAKQSLSVLEDARAVVLHLARMISGGVPSNDQMRKGRGRLVPRR